MISNQENIEKNDEEAATQSECEKTQRSSAEQSPLRSDGVSSDDPSDRSILERSTSKILTSMEVVTVENEDVGGEKTTLSGPDSMVQIFIQSFIPFFLGGIGSIMAGLLLTYANRTLELLREVPEFLVLIPPLQGLKGNLDMTFSARMSTMAHLGEFDRPDIRQKVLRNIAVTEAQSIYVCLVANAVSFLIILTGIDQANTMSAPPTDNNLTAAMNVEHITPHTYIHSFLFLGSSSILSMAINCGISTIMLALIVDYTWKHRLNPDNIVTPLGSSAGDLLTISAMLIFCYFLRPFCEFSDWFPAVLLVTSMVFIPLWLFFAKGDIHAMKTAKQQCFTLILSTSVSCLAGFIQSKGAKYYPNYPAYQTLISGLTGNRCAVQASRISSYLGLKKQSELEWSERISPYAYYTSTSNECRTARLLLFTSIPFQLIFMTISYLISYLIQTPVEHSLWFFFGYSLIVLIQVCIIMYLTQLIVVGLWSVGLDPDMHAIPMLTAAADVCGCGLLYLLFIVLEAGLDCVFTSEQEL